ncbi:hypothetical protein FOA52_011414 [Chlamydomonas sp. UWO 241]|nr:hypothetical protein FOA52_011414 [Chlamydomonas sp. UWO 241]
MQAVTRTSTARLFTGVRTATVAPLRTSVLVAAKPTKAADFTGLSNEEIVSKVQSLKEELASVRFLQRTRGIAEIKKGEQQNPDPEKVPKAHMNKHVRTQVAQLLTIMRARQIEDGINRKQAKQIEKRVMLAGRTPRSTAGRSLSYAQLEKLKSNN